MCKYCFKMGFHGNTCLKYSLLYFSLKYVKMRNFIECRPGNILIALTGKIICIAIDDIIIILRKQVQFSFFHVIYYKATLTKNLYLFIDCFKYFQRKKPPPYNGEGFSSHWSP